MRWDEWFKPALIILFLIAGVSITVLGWFGLTLLRQESTVQSQHAQERLEQSADRVSARLRVTVSQISTNLATRRPDPADSESLILTFHATDLTSSRRLLYWPFPSTDPEAPFSMFLEGESLEYRQGQPYLARVWYSKLAASLNPAVRAGALLREARVLRNLGKSEESQGVYRKLTTLEGVQIAGAPADLVGRLALGGDLANLQQALLESRWRLTRGQFEFYWNQCAPNQQPPAEKILWADSASLLARTRPESNQILFVHGTPLYLIAAGNRAFIVRPEVLMRRATANEPILYAAVDPSGRILAGRKDGDGRPVIRTAAESQLPWTLSFTRAPSLSDSDLANRKRFLLLGLGVTVLFLGAGTFFIAHAIQREAQLARLQAGFIAAVSHEFRSPLTSLRHLSEILAEGRLPREERRQLYYDNLVHETHRLQRLVETLLNFGGMEAGTRPYNLQPVDLSRLIERVRLDLEAQRRIEVTGSAASCLVEADPEALSIALRNLLDNALKYSPADSLVRLDWSFEGASAAIRVHDQGAGIHAAERKIIFKKFVRGSAAAQGNVKGTGVGLAIVDHIVKAHRGSIHVASEPGRGSTFTLHMPLAQRT
jgi:signal transduction histidine kinase